ncbi:MAG: DUF5107 domain-containing protein [Planctomycetes bacterium]|nr:DUF5107 domain-containing protein [Planctomycetota bacterium]
MKAAKQHFPIVVLFLLSTASSTGMLAGEVRAWQATVTLPTYPWQEDVNPKFWAMDKGPRFSTTVRGAIIYPYTMQDHLSRRKVPKTYKALMLENEYLKVVCLPELGGRLYSVLDKTQNQPMFHLNRVIKPGMIAMRGAWISGGVEWNTGPHGHTVTAVSPVDATLGHNPDGSAFIEVNNVEQIFRTRWTVRVTLHPGRAYLDERIRLFNPTDTPHPYYFWNCTAFPNRPGTRFIYPMSLGTDHFGRKFFSWPIHNGKDLTWLKNYETYQSIFAVQCTHDFFGAYDVDADRGVVQVADHRQLSGKKAWTWGEWDFGKVAQQNLTDEDGPYIEVQSGPLPTQSDYGELGPREAVSWQEWWYPVHGLGDGFEYATQDVAFQTARQNGSLTLRMMATAVFRQARCSVRIGRKVVFEQAVDLSPKAATIVKVTGVGDRSADIVLTAANGRTLAAFTTPLPIPKVDPPSGPWLADRPEKELTAEEAYLRGRAAHRATDRNQARRFYELALKRDPGLVSALRGLAILDLDAGRVKQAVQRLKKALRRDADDGRSWFYLGVCRLREDQFDRALDCAFRAVRCFGTVSLGYDLAGRAYMRMGRYEQAVSAFDQAIRANGNDPVAQNHLMLALYAAGQRERAFERAADRIAQDPTDLVPRALQALAGRQQRSAFVKHVRETVGEIDFEMIETGLMFAELGLVREAADLLAAVCVEGQPTDERNPLVLYYLAYWSAASGRRERSQDLLRQAAGICRDFVFPSRVEAEAVLRFALQFNPNDGHAHLHLGNLLGHFGRLNEAAAHWQQGIRFSRCDAARAMACRNLGLYRASVRTDLAGAAEFYRKAIAARPDDQTLYRDLAEILIADGKRPEAIRVMETMPHEGLRRADILILLAQAYFDEKRYGDTIRLLESTPYFVNWEGQDITWRLFNQAHVARGKQRLERGDLEAALEDFEAALTYPKNIGVGRSNKPEEAAAQYWRGRALQALGRLKEAQAAWRAGAALPEGSKEQNKYRQLCRKALAGRNNAKPM